MEKLNLLVEKLKENKKLKRIILYIFVFFLGLMLGLMIK